jgi:hypothetical protein
MIEEDAQGIAAHERGRAADLHRQYLELKTQVDELKSQYDAAITAANRLSSFKSKTSEGYQCPSCWIKRNIQVLILPKPSQTNDDIFECVSCKHNVTVTY